MKLLKKIGVVLLFIIGKSICMALGDMNNAISASKRN